MRAAVLCVLLAGCGGTTSDPQTGADVQEGCDLARLEAQRAWREVAREAEAVDPAPDGPPVELESVVERLRAHVEGLRADPREVDGELAFSLADAIMGGLDEVATDIPEGLRQRADDAAEAMLTDRSAQGAVRATSDALAIVEEVLAQARPERAAARSAQWGVGELARRAARAADAYGDGVRDGDREAGRAEDLEVAADLLAAERRRATDASRGARERCGVTRALRVPAPG